MSFGGTLRSSPDYLDVSRDIPRSKEVELSFKIFDGLEI